MPALASTRKARAALAFAAGFVVLIGGATLAAYGLVSLFEPVFLTVESLGNALFSGSGDPTVLLAWGPPFVWFAGAIGAFSIGWAVVIHGIELTTERGADVLMPGREG